jgi:hypothetical protein
LTERHLTERPFYRKKSFERFFLRKCRFTEKNGNGKKLKIEK